VTKPKLFRDGISSFAEDGFTINGRPTFYIVIIMVAVFGAASYFLQEHVLSANSAHEADFVLIYYSVSLCLVCVRMAYLWDISILDVP
jgi:hypothetical protein